MGSTRVITLGATVGAVVAIVGFAACSGGRDDSSSATMAGSATTVVATTTAGMAQLSADVDRSAEAPAQPLVQTAGQAIAVTARTTVQTVDVAVAVDRITTAVTTRGGRIASADIDDAASDDPNAAHATLTVAIPPTELDAVRGALADVGRVVSFQQDATDVSDQLTDLDTRIANQRASVARIRELYSTATDVDAIVRIEADLTNRETALEQLLASQAALKDRVTMSTLTIDLTTTPPATTTADGSTGLADALGGGWSAFAGAMFAVVLVLTAAMPFVLMCLVMFLIAWWLRKTSRRSRTPLSPRRGESEPLRDAVASRQE
jgi:hypothetical protein